jgi:hypothetical protein
MSTIRAKNIAHPSATEDQIVLNADSIDLPASTTLDGDNLIGELELKLDTTTAASTYVPLSGGTVTGTLIADSFRTLNGVTAATASGASVVLFEMPINSVWFVSVAIPSAGTARYDTVAVTLRNNGNSSRADYISRDGSPLSAITVSGANVQASQSSGTTSAITWHATRIR